jgi:hypothetical protein
LDDSPNVEALALIPPGDLLVRVLLVVVVVSSINSGEEEWLPGREDVKEVRAWSWMEGP